MPFLTEEALWDHSRVYGPRHGPTPHPNPQGTAPPNFPTWCWDHEVQVSGAGVQVYRREAVRTRKVEDFLYLGPIKAATIVTYAKTIYEYWGQGLGRWHRDKHSWETSAVAFSFGGIVPGGDDRW